MEVVVPVNYLAVLAAGILSVVIGSLWYGPLFGKEWMRMMKIKMPAKMDDAMKKEMMKSYTLTTLASLVMAYVLSHTLVFASTYMKVEGISVGWSTGFWMWLGFVVPVSLNSVLWENKPWKLFGINVGYHLVNLLLMGSVLAVWR